MSGMLGTFEGAVAQGVLWAVMVLGVYITYKILDIADLTVDGSFSLGGCTCAALLFQGINPILALFSVFWQVWRQEPLPVFFTRYLRYRQYWRES